MLICFHHAGGSARVFTNWKKKIQNIEIVGIDMPKRGEKYGIDFPENINSFAYAVAMEISPQIQGRDFVLYGHSLGALIAFLTASFLEREFGLTAKGLIVSGRHAPDQINFSPYKHGMGREALIKAIREYGLTPKELLDNQEFMDYYLPIVEKDYAWSEKYTYQRECLKEIPIKAYASSEDIEATPEIMQMWENMTQSDFAIERFTGGHFFPFHHEEEYLLEMKKTLSTWFNNKREETISL